MPENAFSKPQDLNLILDLPLTYISLHTHIIVQVVPERPITWCDDANQPNTLIGNITWWVCPCFGFNAGCLPMTHNDTLQGVGEI